MTQNTNISLSFFSYQSCQNSFKCLQFLGPICKFVLNAEPEFQIFKVTYLILILFQFLGKRVAETLAYAYAKQSKVQIRVARIFNTYGPRMHMNDGRVVSNFVLQALEEEPMTVRIWYFVAIIVLISCVK